jgi:glutaredoxin
MSPIKLYTSRNCPICEQVKGALKDLPHEIYSSEEHMDDLMKEVTDRDLSPGEIRQAPVMIVPDCELVWTGADCLIAIEEEEWK